MFRKITNYYANRLISRWVILLLDVLFVIISFVFAYALRFNFNLTLLSGYALKEQLLVISILYLAGFLIFKPYSGIIRHTSINDMEHILWGTLSGFMVYIGLNALVDKFGWFTDLRIPLSILIIHFLLVTFLMIGVRFFIKAFYFNVVQKKKERKPIMIYGAGKSGLIAKHALEQDDQYKYRVVAFVDDHGAKVGKKLEGVPILSRETINEAFIRRNGISEVIIAIQKISTSKKNRLIEYFLNVDVVLKNIPSTSQWMNGEFSSKQIKNIRIEDLLERDEIRLDHKSISDQVKNKVVLVTGAAGSIGSEIATQLLHYKPSELILVDQAESPLHELMLDLEERFNGLPEKQVKAYVCDVCNRVRTNSIFEKHRPDVVYHAAAYKHVPLMELNPAEAIEVNVFGTKNITDLAVKYQASTFVLVSTDKAVNPANIMGASKRIAEMYCQSSQSGARTKFITTRFGNVLGSNGSVVPLFKKQIRQGGPVTITHPEVTRFFMTIPEACELVLEAGAMGNGGEIYVFDMGEPVKIIDLAKKMIRLSGYGEKEIGIKTIGLRPGEKLYEEVLSMDENTLETHHPRINIAQVREVSNEMIVAGCGILQQAMDEGNEYALVRQMKLMVPEFLSNNSIFESLDALLKEDEEMEERFLTE